MDPVPVQSPPKRRKENDQNGVKTFDGIGYQPVPEQPELPEEVSDEDGDNQSGLENGKKEVALKTSLFSEEIIEKIFSHLKTTREALPVSNSSLQFNRIMAPTKPLWAFDQVFDLIFPELDKADMLNCRLVCKRWKHSVDSTLQALPANRNLAPFPEERNSNGNRPLYAPQFDTNLICNDLSEVAFFTPAAIMDFMATMETHPDNPFVLRSVGFGNSTSSGIYWDLVLALLRRFGSHIWSVYVCSCIETVVELGNCFNYELCCQVLDHLPNLKNLGLYGVLNGYVNRPLPDLPHLVTMDFLMCKSGGLPFVNEPFFKELMTRYGSKLKKFSPTYLSAWHGRDAQCYQMPIVNEIMLNVDTGGPRHWADFCRKLAAPNLTKLSLLLCQTVQIYKLLRPLSENLKSLKYLRLLLHGRELPRETSIAPKLRLDNVKTLEVLNGPNVQYDLLFTYLPSLEYLMVCHEQQYGVPNISFKDPSQWEIFKWINGQSINRSDIWNRLASLKEVTLARLGDNGEDGTDTEALRIEIRARKTFTREMYENQVEE